MVLALALTFRLYEKRRSSDNPIRISLGRDRQEPRSDSKTVHEPAVLAFVLFLFVLRKTLRDNSMVPNLSAEPHSSIKDG